MQMIILHKAKYAAFLAVVCVLALAALWGAGSCWTIYGLDTAVEEAPPNIPLVPEYHTDKDHGAVVLMYHHIVADDDFATGQYAGNNAIISLGQFEEEMAYLAAHGYNTFTMSEAAGMLYNKLPFPEKSVIITFDDGYESNYLLAYPLLKKYELKATVAAVVVSTVQAEAGGAQNIPHLTFAQMQEMQDSGLVEIGSHSYNGHGMIVTGANGAQGKFFVSRMYLPEEGRKETAAEYIERITQDLRRSKDVLEGQLGAPVNYFAYPYGVVDSDVVGALNQNDFLVAVTTASGAINKNSDPFRLNRRNVDQNISVNQFAALLKAN